MPISKENEHYLSMALAQDTDDSIHTGHFFILYLVPRVLRQLHVAEGYGKIIR
jgi:hypothetical protein